MRLTLRETGDAVAVASRKISSVDEMLRAIEEVLGEEGAQVSASNVQHWLHLVGPEVLDEAGEGTERRALWEMRHRSMGFMVDGVIGQITLEHFKGMIRSALLSTIAAVSNAFPGSWRVCAASPVESHKPRWSRQATGVSWAQSQSLTQEQILREEPNTQQTRPVMVKDRRMVLEIALVEVQQAPPHDPLFNDKQSGRNTTGALYMYAQSGGELRYLSAKDAANREAAKELIRRFYAENPTPAWETKTRTKTDGSRTKSKRSPDLL